MVLTKRGGPTETTAFICDNPRHAIARSGHQYLNVRRRNGHAPSETLADRKGFLPTGKPSPFSLEDPADTADSYACWTDENADEAAVGWTERVRQDRPFLKEAPNASADPKRNIRPKQSNGANRRTPVIADRSEGSPLSSPGINAARGGLGLRRHASRRAGYLPGREAYPSGTPTFRIIS